MSVAKVIRYTTKPESAEENERLIRAVFAELASEQPEGLQYASFRLDDGVSFVHVAIIEATENPLQSSAAFSQFQSGIGARVVAGPDATDATVIGSYRMA
jgi:hypothetical protein